MGAMASQFISVSIIYSTICSGTDQRKHQSSASLAFVRGIHRWLVNSPHKVPITRKMIPFDDVIMNGCKNDKPYQLATRTYCEYIGIVHSQILTHMAQSHFWLWTTDVLAVTWFTVPGTSFDVNPIHWNKWAVVNKWIELMPTWPTNRKCSPCSGVAR